jgi:integrase
MRSRIETWKNVESQLRRFISPRLGKMLANEVTNRDIAQLSDDIVAGEFGKPSTANARHMRRAASAMFTSAAGPSRGYVTASPCIHLGKLDEEYPRERVLTEAEIKTLWHGLDRREGLPWDRRTRLAIKFALVTMLRSGELLPIHRDELNTENGTVDIPARRVKKRRVINQPLSDLALEIVKEALSDDGQQFVFKARSVTSRWNARQWRPRFAVPCTRTARRRRRASANCSALRHFRRTICGGRRRQCAATLVCRKLTFRSASIIRRARMSTASRCRRSPTGSIISPLPPG